MAKKIIVSTANDENDDWLKKLKDGWYKERDLKAHKDAAKTKKKQDDSGKKGNDRP